jgi:hypothetical protein
MDHLAEKCRIDTRPDPYNGTANLNLNRRRTSAMRFSATIGTNSDPGTPASAAAAARNSRRSRRADCDAAHSAARSRSSPLPASGSPRQSPPSRSRSTGAVVAFRSAPPLDGNCAHQLANYLAHQPRCLARTRQHQPITVPRRNVGVRRRLRRSAPVCRRTDNVRRRLGR